MNGLVYYIQRDDGLIKIGCTRRPIYLRLGELCRAHGYLRLLAVQQGRLELSMHRKFRGDRVEGEWFRASEALLGHIRMVQSSVLDQDRINPDLACWMRFDLWRGPFRPTYGSPDERLPG